MKQSKQENKLQEEILSLEKQVAELPKGKLICVRNGKYIKWFQSDGHEQIYIPKKRVSLAKSLAKKKYLQTKLEELKQEQLALKFYFKHQSTPKSLEMLKKDSPYFELLQDEFVLQSEELKKWQQSSYKKNPNHQEYLLHPTIDGNVVRSKSEAMISMILYLNKIPYHYEEELILNGIPLYPDFTIRHPKTGEVFYFEHFGMMDDPEYCQNVCSKLHIYTSNHIIPTINLITTYETKEHPLNLKEVEDVVKKYFLV